MERSYLTWPEYCTLCSLMYCVDEGLPEHFVPSETSGGSEDDPRGYIPIETSTKTFNDLIKRGLIEIKWPGQPTSKHFYAYITLEGIEAFEENKDYWNAEWKRLFKEQRKGSLG